MCCTISLIWRSLSWITFFCKSLYWPILFFACNSQGIPTLLLVQKRHVILNSLLIQKSTIAQFSRIPFCKLFKTRYKVKCGQEGELLYLTEVDEVWLRIFAKVEPRLRNLSLPRTFYTWWQSFFGQQLLAACSGLRSRYDTRTMFVCSVQSVIKSCLCKTLEATNTALPDLRV